MPTSTLERLRRLVNEIDDVGDINPEDNIRETGFDSLDLVEITMAVEEDFHIDISDDQLEKFQTFGDIIAYIDTHVRD